MKIGQIYSLSTCIIEKDHIVWETGLGSHYKEIQQKPTTDTIYLVASISKSVTATAVLQLYEKGLFDLDDDISPALGFDLYNPYFPDIPITYRMLLNHTAGLAAEPIWFYELFYEQDPPALKSWMYNYFYDNGSIDKQNWRKQQPGMSCTYLNLGFSLLAYLVEQWTDMSFETYCQKYIFRPLDMHNTSFMLSKINKSHTAPAYVLAYTYQNNDHNYFVCLPRYSFKFYPAGGLFTTVEDLSHFLIMHMNEGLYHNREILNKSTICEMHTVSFDRENGSDFGLGWCIQSDRKGEPKFGGHDGSFYGYTSIMQHRFADDRGFIILSSLDVSGGYVRQLIHDVYFGLIKYLIYGISYM